MSNGLTCVEREEENRWVGRVFESKTEDGAAQYTYSVIPPLQFQQGHSVTPAPDTSTHAVFPTLDEARTAMRSELHRLTGIEAS